MHYFCFASSSFWQSRWLPGWEWGASVLLAAGRGGPDLWTHSVLSTGFSMASPEISLTLWGPWVSSWYPPLKAVSTAPMVYPLSSPPWPGRALSCWPRSPQVSPLSVCHILHLAPGLNCPHRHFHSPVPAPGSQHSYPQGIWGPFRISTLPTRDKKDLKETLSPAFSLPKDTMSPSLISTWAPCWCTGCYELWQGVLSGEWDTMASTFSFPLNQSRAFTVPCHHFYLPGKELGPTRSGPMPMWG